MRPSSSWKLENACGRLFLWSPKFALKPTSIFVQRVFLFFFFFVDAFNKFLFEIFEEKKILKLKLGFTV
jgi:hypothetical protein